MQSYRRLALEELEAVRPEFIRFLASEGIAADDWEQKLREGSTDVEACLDEFSETFWESATGAIACLEHKPNSDSLWVFHFAESAAHVIQCTKQDGKVRWSQGGKNYAQETRGREIFLMLEQGALPCSEERFNEVRDQMIAVTHQA